MLLDQEEVDSGSLEVAVVVILMVSVVPGMEVRGFLVDHMLVLAVLLQDKVKVV